MINQRLPGTSTNVRCTAEVTNGGKPSRAYAYPGPLQPILDTAAFATCP